MHFQSESGLDHRAIVLSPQRARLLRALWSRWGVTLILALTGSWLYFAFESSRVPFLTRRVADLETERLRIDSLQSRLHSLQQQYDQVQRMLGVVPSSAGAGVNPPANHK